MLVFLEVSTLVQTEETLFIFSLGTKHYSSSTSSTSLLVCLGPQWFKHNDILSNWLDNDKLIQVDMLMVMDITIFELCVQLCD